MNRLIDADALEKVFFTMSMCSSSEYCKAFNAGAERMFEEIKNAPTVDAVEVVHGEWCEIRIGWVPVGYRCSECYKRSDENANYCPNCGAKMDKHRESEDE